MVMVRSERDSSSKKRPKAEGLLRCGGRREDQRFIVLERLMLEGCMRLILDGFIRMK